MSIAIAPPGGGVLAQSLTAALTAPAGPDGQGPEHLAVNPQTKQVYVANFFNSTLTVIDGAQERVLATVPIGAQPLAIGLNPATKRVYVAGQTGRNAFAVIVFDGATYAIVGKVDLPAFTRPRAVAVNPVTNKAYVGANLSGAASLTVIDGAANTVSGVIDLGYGSVFGLVVNPNTNRLYATNGSITTTGGLRVIDGGAGKVIATIPVRSTDIAIDTKTNRVFTADLDNGYRLAIIDGASDTVASTIALVSSAEYGEQVAVDAEANRIYRLLGSSADADPVLRVIDGSSHAIVKDIPLGTEIHDLGVNPLAHRVYAPDFARNLVHVIDGNTNTPVARIPTATSPASVGVDGGRNRLYVANEAHDTVGVFDATSLQPLKRIRVGLYPRSVAVDAALNRVYAVNVNTLRAGHNGLHIIDTTSDQVVTKVPFTQSPYWVAVNPQTHRVYVSSSGSSVEDGLVTVVDGATNAVVTSVKVGKQPGRIAINAKTNTIYVAHRDTSAVTVLDGATNTISATIATKGVRDLAVNDTLNRVYSLNHPDNIEIIDGATNTILGSFKLTSAGGGYPTSIVADPGANLLYVAYSDFPGTQPSVVQVLNAANGSVVNALGIGVNPVDLTIDPAAHKVYSANRASSTLTRIDGSTAQATDAKAPVLGDPAVEPVTLPGPGGVITLSVVASDDFGVASVDAELTRDDGSKQTLSMSTPPANIASGKWSTDYRVAANNTSAVQTYTVKFTAKDFTGNQGASSTVSFKVVPAPTISSLSPSQGAQGETLDVVITGAAFQDANLGGANSTRANGLPDVDFGSGITVQTVKFDSATQLTVTIAIDKQAQLGKRTAKVTNPDGQAGSKPQAFEVVAPPTAPEVTGLSPAQGERGATLALDITGQRFADGATVDLGTGITVTSVSFVSPTSLTVKIDIAVDAALGLRPVKVTNPNGEVGEKADAFRVVAPASAPSITSVSPASGVQGATLDVDITGDNFVDGAKADFGAGITVNSTAFTSATSLKSNLTIATNATVGKRAVKVTNPDSKVGVKLGGFEVTAPAPAPDLTAVDPAFGVVGTTLTVTLAGSDFKDNATVSFGAGITVDSVTVVSDTKLTVTITIAADAAQSARDVAVTNPDGQADTLTGAFTVIADARFISTANKTATPGALVRVSVSISEADGVAGFDITISGCTGVWQPESPYVDLTGGLLEGKNWTTNVTTGADSIRVAAFQPQLQALSSGSGILFHALFRVDANASAGSCTIDVKPALSNAQGSEITSQGVPGKLTITSCVKGDIDGDGDTDIFDVIKALRCALNLTASDGNCDCGDMDCDGDVDIFDVIKVLRKALSLTVADCQ